MVCAEKEKKKERMVVVKEVSAEYAEYDELVSVLCSVYIYKRENEHGRGKVGVLLISPSTRFLEIVLVKNTWVLLFNVGFVCFLYFSFRETYFSFGTLEKFKGRSRVKASL